VASVPRPRPEARAWLTFVIERRRDRAGAGRALAEIARETSKHDFRHINPTEAQSFGRRRAARAGRIPEDLSAKREKLVKNLASKSAKA